MTEPVHRAMKERFIYFFLPCVEEYWASVGTTVAKFFDFLFIIAVGLPESLFRSSVAKNVCSLPKTSAPLVANFFSFLCDSVSFWFKFF